MSEPLYSLLVYDDTQRALRQKGLSHVWEAGAGLFPFDKVVAAKSWLHVIEELSRSSIVIDRLQFWGHGNARDGYFINDVPIDFEEVGDVLAKRLRRRSQVWFRCCDAFAGVSGHVFARDAMERFGCDVAGHTCVISAPNPLVQSGLHGLRFGGVPHWPKSEGGGSGFLRPNTVSILTNEIPAWAWAS